jgi:2-oxoglutarate dehydrogenase E2 component (dihydrolipoamide succinyltransferase)
MGSSSNTEVPETAQPGAQFFEQQQGKLQEICMSRVDVVMPQMGESIVEGTVSRWIKRVGEDVKRDEAILEISTYKVDAEIPSPAAGTLAEIKVEEGQTVEVATVVAVIETDMGAAAAAAPAPAAPPAEKKASAPAPTEPAEATPLRAEPPPLAAPPSTRVSDETAEERLRRKSTPVVRKIAAEHGVDLAAVEGTGHAGRVTKQDILSFIESGKAIQAPAAPISPAPAPSAVTAAGEIVHPHVEVWDGDRVEVMSRIRKLTADHMVLSRRVSAHVTSFFEVDFTNVDRIRRAVKADYEARGAKLTFLAFIVKAVADNLRKHPVLNASVSGDNVVYRQRINIGIAVALDWGLIVPVLENADELSLIGIAKRMADLSERARTKKLNPEEVQHGTFTITNPGVFGSYTGSPIINQPQVAILCAGTIEKRPKIITLEDGQDVIAVRKMGMLSLSFDHRVVDGADSDRFMADVKRDIEEFSEGVV